MHQYRSSNFSIDIQHQDHHVHIRQQVFHPAINTEQLPQTFAFLQSHLPTIFKNQCFNSRKLPFSQELKRTEIGHLFEHLLLEYLKLEAEFLGQTVSFDGHTSWDWDKNGIGVFDISINLPPPHRNHFLPAFKKATISLEQLYSSH